MRKINNHAQIRSAFSIKSNVAPNKTIRSHGFTLIELIVVIVVMMILTGLSALAYRGIAADLAMSSAMNTVVATLDNARAMAIKKNRYVITVFRPRLDNDGTEQIIDIVVAMWNGDTANATVVGCFNCPKVWSYDRFVPIQGIQQRTIKGGVNVAGPGYGTGDDDTWWVSTYLPANVVVQDNEPFGSLVGVLYNPEGRVVVRNAESGSDRIWVDFNRDGVQTITDDVFVNWPWPASLSQGAYFDLEVQGGEPFISMTTVLAVFDEDECRSLFDTTSWNSGSDRDRDYTTYIDANVDRIQFNRYSGVPLR